MSHKKDKLKPIDRKKQLKDYIGIYVKNIISGGKRYEGDEVEVVFGRGKSISRIDFDNVVSKIKSSGFTCNNESGSYHLNIQNQFIDPKKGVSRMSNIRTTIHNLQNIQEYCKTDKLNFMDDRNTSVGSVTFMQKKPKYDNEIGLFPINYDEFNFRINYKSETTLKPGFGLVKDVIDNWDKTPKIFRLIKRFTFKNDKYPIKIDMSIVRSSTLSRNDRMIPEFRIEKSNVFNNPEIYEIEIEIDNTVASNTEGDEDTMCKIIEASINSNIKLILSGIQETNYPISNTVADDVLANYLHILYQI